MNFDSDTPGSPRVVEESYARPGRRQSPYRMSVAARKAETIHFGHGSGWSACLYVAEPAPVMHRGRVTGLMAATGLAVTMTGNLRQFSQSLRRCCQRRHQWSLRFVTQTTRPFGITVCVGPCAISLGSMPLLL
jgi:hypothetical protein